MTMTRRLEIVIAVASIISRFLKYWVEGICNVVVVVVVVVFAVFVVFAVCVVYVVLGSSGTLIFLNVDYFLITMRTVMNDLLNTMTVITI